MGKNILSIDDDEDILYTIQEIILHQGWTPLLARNFREAEHILTQYGNGRLDLILVDYHLPQPDGIQIPPYERNGDQCADCCAYH